MKYIVILADGMADEPIEQLSNMTPLEFAQTPYMDELASGGHMGLVRTVPQSMKPGSDVANLSVLGYNPACAYSGRSPLEALSIGVPLKETDVVFRCNLVTLSEEEPYSYKKIIDHSSGEITTEEADVLMDAVREAFAQYPIRFYTGTSYRHATIWDNGSVIEMEPPHDHLGEVVEDFLPAHKMFRDIMERSFQILNNHPVNISRQQRGLNKANSLWFWGAGTKPHLTSFVDKTGLSGAMISAVDLLKGIAVGTDMNVIQVPGATGSLHTNYEGKANAALDALLKEGLDFVYIHIEGPDEMGHQGLVQEKIQAIEYIDSRILGILKEKMDQSNEPYRIMLLPDHPTPIRYRTHTSDPVPFVIYDSEQTLNGSCGFSEREAAQTGIFVDEGHLLINMFIGGEEYGKSL